MHFTRINQKLTFGVHEGVNLGDLISAKPWYIESLLKYDHITLSKSLQKKLDKRINSLKKYNKRSK